MLSGPSRPRERALRRHGRAARPCRAPARGARSTAPPACCDDRLVAEADAEQRHLALGERDQLEAAAGIVAACPGPGERTISAPSLAARVERVARRRRVLRSTCTSQPSRSNASTRLKVKLSRLSISRTWRRHARASAAASTESRAEALRRVSSASALRIAVVDHAGAGADEGGAVLHHRRADDDARCPSARRR